MHFDHFNFIAGIYDRAGKFILDEPLKGALSLSSDHSLLDAGGGTGRVTDVIRSKVREVYVVDTSFGMLRQARKKDLKTIIAPVEKLPFVHENFDRIIVIDALHHVRDQKQTIVDLWRVLKPKGRIVIVEPDIRKRVVKAIAIGEKILLMRSHFLTGEEIRSLFTGTKAEIHVFYDRNNIYAIAQKDKVGVN